MNDMMTHYTAFIKTTFLEELKELEDYVILTSKPCIYTNDEYTVIEFISLGENAEDYDPEKILKDMKALVLHEEGSNSFLILEEDLIEIEELFNWDSGGSVLMSELLTTEDKKIILLKKQRKEKITGQIKMNIGSKEKPEWKLINEIPKQLFGDLGCAYKFSENLEPVDIWWPFLMGEIGGFNFIIQKIAETKDFDKKPKHDSSLYPIIKHQDSFWDDYDDPYDYYEEYDWLNMHR